MAARSDSASARQAEFADALLAARRSGVRLDVPAGMAALTLDDAFAIQDRVREALGEAAPLAKVELSRDGTEPVLAPIFASAVVANGGTATIPACGLVGLEIEIALRLGRDLPLATADPAQIVAAIDACFVGIELIGPRIADHRRAPYASYLADNLGNAGYVIDTGHAWPHGPQVDGKPITIRIDGQTIVSATALHPLGVTTVLARLAGAARAGSLKRGCIVTTGKLCPLVPLQGPARIEAQLAERSLAFTLA